MWNQFILGAFFSILVAGVAFRRDSLSVSGFIAACVVGTVIYGFGSVFWFGLLLCFFITSSMWSKYHKQRKGKVEDLFAKSGRRDALQVLANGGLGSLLAVINYLSPSSSWMVIYLGILATVNADTWGTEIGVLSRSTPRHILTWQKVEKGTSGGVSWLGFLASCAGALLIGACGSLLYFYDGNSFQPSLIWIGLFSGLVGAYSDSILGATIQQMYFCSECGRQTEKAFHCGKQTSKAKGVSWCNNDVVNLTSSLMGGLSAWLVYYYISN